MAGYQGTSTRNHGMESLHASLESERGDIMTMVMGEVVSYDPAKQTAVIQPRMKRKIGDEDVRAPELQEVPILFPRAGGMILHNPLQKGDEVEIRFSQRSLDESADDASDQSGDRGGRMHHMSDAVATPSSYSKPKQLKDMPTDRLHFGSEDGKSGFQMKKDGTSDIVKGNDSMWKIIGDLTAAFRDHVHSGDPNDKKPDAIQLVTRIDQIKTSA